VIAENDRFLRWTSRRARNGAAIDRDLIGRTRAYAKLCRFAVDGHTPSANPLFDLAPRAETESR